jgi:hypothetical protein
LEVQIERYTAIYEVGTIILRTKSRGRLGLGKATGRETLRGIRYAVTY